MSTDANTRTIGAQPRKTAKELQKELGINRGTWQRYIRLATLYEPVQEMVLNNKLTVSDASRHIASLSLTDQKIFFWLYKDEEKIPHRQVTFFCNVIIPEIRKEQQSQNK